MILAGDIGGTKTNLALYEWTNERVEPVRLESFHSGDYTALEDILVEFLTPPQPPRPVESLETEESDKGKPAERQPPERVTLAAACFGIAGPVIDNRCQTTNLPWIVDGRVIAKRFEIPRVQLLNDLESTAYGVLWLRSDELEVLNAGDPPKKRQALALIAARHWAGRRHSVLGRQIVSSDAVRRRPCGFCPEQRPRNRTASLSPQPVPPCELRTHCLRPRPPCRV